MSTDDNYMSVSSGSEAALSFKKLEPPRLLAWLMLLLSPLPTPTTWPLSSLPSKFVSKICPMLRERSLARSEVSNLDLTSSSSSDVSSSRVDDSDGLEAHGPLGGDDDGGAGGGGRVPLPMLTCAKGLA